MHSYQKIPPEFREEWEHVLESRCVYYVQKREEEEGRGRGKSYDEYSGISIKVKRKESVLRKLEAAVVLCTSSHCLLDLI